jgi:hypothetical protein
MALVAGDIVSPIVFIAAPSVQGPVFGIVDDAAGLDVLWNNGTFVQGLTAVSPSLDKIGTADPAVAARIVGRRVQVNDPAGQNIWGLCVCISVYTRQINGGPALARTMALLQNPTGEYFIEVLASDCTAVQ